jgi:hypothetical protein
MIHPSNYSPTSEAKAETPDDWRKLHRPAAMAAWSVIAMIHVLALLFFSISALAYIAMNDRAVKNFLTVNRIGMDSQYYGAIALSFGLVALFHFWQLLRMVVLSAQQRRLIFINKPVQRVSATSRVGIARTIWRALLLAYDAVFSPFGLMGMSGPCFDLLLLLREVVETALQTVQAYRLSQVLARTWLNKFYVSLLVINCWLVALVHTLFHDRPVPKYFLSLLCDFALDFMSSIGVTLALVAVYSLEMEEKDVFGVKWFNDAWLANAISEFRLILVVSWADLASRLVFAVSMVSNLNLLKRFASMATDQAANIKGPSHGWGTIVPSSTVPHSGRRRSTTKEVLVSVNTMVRVNPVLTKLQRIAFVAWGALVLGFHVRASFNPALPQCAMQVRPWGVTRPACNLVVIDCYRDGIAGHASEIQASLEPLYAPSIGRLTIRHCIALEMPSTIQSLSNLESIKLYNTSIAKWEDAAALTATSHPVLVNVNIHRAQMPDGLIPRGLQSLDFPSTCNVFSFVATNLGEIPDDLDAKWPHGRLVDFGFGNLTVIPDTLLRLNPILLLLEATAIENVPQEVFELSEVRVVDLRDTQVSSLPSELRTLPSKLSSMNLDNTLVSSFPEWVDEWLEFPGDYRYPERISAAESPYCKERERIFAGKLAAFSVSTGSRLMDASPANWDYLKRGVSCTPTAMYRYPIEVDDTFDALPQHS